MGRRLLQKAIVFVLILLLVVPVLPGCRQSPALPTLKNTEVVLPEPGFYDAEFRVYNKVGETVLEMEEVKVGPEEQLNGTIKLNGVDYTISMMGRLEGRNGTNLSIYVQYRLGDLLVDGIFDYETPIIDQEIYQNLLKFRQNPRVQELTERIEHLDITPLVDEDLPSLKSMLLDEKDREELEQIFSFDPGKALSYYHSEVSEIINIGLGFGLDFTLGPEVGIPAHILCFFLLNPSDLGTGDQYEYVTCGTCGGSGLAPGTAKKCYECAGTGLVKCTACGGTGKIDCTGCKGSGKVECPVCAGTGLVKCTACGGTGQKICSDCNGTGTCPGMEGPCPTCGGKGKVKCTECDGTGLVKCKACGGTGKIDCPDCKGAGKVECPVCRGYWLKCTACGGTGIAPPGAAAIVFPCPKCGGTGIEKKIK